MAEPAHGDDPDVALMLRLQAGEREALGELLRRHHLRVLNLAYRYLGDRARAEDVVQETFLRLYQARDRYRPDAPFHSYLLRIASNLCLSQLRRRRPAASLTGAGEEEGGVELPDPSQRAPAERLEEAELHARVRAALAGLPERWRMALLLNKFEGLDYREVAAQLDLTVPATKSLLHRARMALKDALLPYLEEGDERGETPAARPR